MSSLEPRSQAPTRYPEIDIAKGLAILCVLLIHAEPLVGTFVHAYIVDRAVPVLLLLFGTSSELWWRRAERQSSQLSCARQFVRTRLLRLLLPVWAALSVWWVLRLLASAAGRPSHVPSAQWLLPHALGYIPQIGTGWFVTLILQLVFWFPLVRWLLQRCGPVLTVLLTAAVHIVSQLYILQVVDIVRYVLRDSADAHGMFVFYYAWIFSPARLLLLVTGVLLARSGLQLPKRGLQLAAAVWVLGCCVHALMKEPIHRSTLLSLLDIPLTFLWLAASRGLIRLPESAVLAWLGRESWAMYLGQLVTHTSARLFGYVVEDQPLAQRFAYVALLLAGGVGWVFLGEAINSRVRAFSRARTQDKRDDQHEPERA